MFSLESGLKCDWCSSADLAWEYPVDSFTTEIPWVSSQENWLACDGCSTLIEAGQWDALEDACIDAYRAAGQKMSDFEEPIMRRVLRGLWSDFVKHRKGERFAYEKECTAEGA